MKVAGLLDHVSQLSYQLRPGPTVSHAKHASQLPHLAKVYLLLHSRRFPSNMTADPFLYLRGRLLFELLSFRWTQFLKHLFKSFIPSLPFLIALLNGLALRSQWQSNRCTRNACQVNDLRCCERKRRCSPLQYRGTLWHPLHSCHDWL